MKIETQKRIYRDYKAEKITKIGCYEYSIQYHPMAVNHTWIIRRKRGRDEWEWYCPLDEEVR